MPQVRQRSYSPHDRNVRSRGNVESMDVNNTVALMFERMMRNFNQRVVGEAEAARRQLRARGRDHSPRRNAARRVGGETQRRREVEDAQRQSRARGRDRSPQRNAARRVGGETQRRREVEDAQRQSRARGR